MDLQAETRRLAENNRGRQVQQPIFLSGYADASMSGDRTRAGYGAWVRDSTRRILLSGPLPSWVTDVNQAELAALFAAAYMGLTKLDYQNSNIFVLKTDSQAAARWLGWDGSSRLPRHERVLKLVYQIYDLAEKLDIKIVATWVQGHQGTKTTAGWLNNRVDKMAREARMTGKRFRQYELITPG